MIYRKIKIDEDEFDEYRYKNEPEYKAQYDDLQLIKNSKHYKFKKDKYYLACYDVLEDEIYFNEFFTGEIIKNNKRLSYQRKKYQKRLYVLRSYWGKIEKISGFNKDSYISTRAKNYFKRTINSKFLFNETKGLFTNNNCYALPNIFQLYGGVQIEVKVHFSVFDIENEKEEVKNIITEFDDKEKKKEENDEQINPLIEDFVYKDNIPFLYVVDTIIKETLRLLHNYIKLRVKIEKEKNSKSEKNNNEDILQSSKKSDEETTYLNYKNMFQTLRESMQINSNYQFVLKLYGFEEYLYGDYSIGSYECIRNYVRQFEKVKLVLYKKPKYEINPPISSFPPIILSESNKEFTYFELLDKYLYNYPHHSAIFRFGESENKQKEQFFNIYKSRQEKLTQYTESGNCDFPLQITLVGVYNINSIFSKWLNDENYTKNEMMLPYFNEFQTKQEYEQSLFKNKLFKFFGCGKNSYDNSENNNTENISPEIQIITKEQSKKDKEKAKEKKKEKEKEIKDKKKAINLIHKSTKQNITLQKNLNFFKIFHKEEQEKLDTLKNKFTAPTLPQEANNKRDELEDNPFYKEKNSKMKHLKYPPIFIKIQLDILYGSFQVETLLSKHYIISNNINMMETITFNNDKLLISHLPRETRLGITLIMLNRDISSPIELGSCQIPIFTEDGVMNSGEIKLNFWPFFKIEPRINCCDPFLFKKNNSEKNNLSNSGNDGNANLDNNEKNEIKLNNDKIDEINTNKNNTDLKLKSIIKDMVENTLNNNNLINSTLNDNNQKKNEEDSDEEDKNIEPYPEYKETEIDESNYCYIIIQFPKFAKNLAHVEKSPSNYRKFLSIKHKGKNPKEIYSEFNELYGTMISEIDDIMDEIKEIGNKQKTSKHNSNTNINNKELYSNNNKESEKEIMLDLTEFEKNLIKIDKILKKEPLAPINQEERRQILICRDYISTIPKTIDIFLRSINWFNPLQSYIAHLYLKKWNKLTPEDAIGLLDSRFPDIQVRELAIKTLYNTSEDIIELYLMQLCQCLFYENYLVSPLADFLIEKSLSNQKLLGNKFYWSAKVGCEHFLFKDRLNIILAQLFMVSGPQFINSITYKIEVNNEFKRIANQAKILYTIDKNKVGPKVKEEIKELKKKGYVNFDLPVHPSYYVSGYDLTKVKAFDSKMVPIRIVMTSSDGGKFGIIYKIGDDLRQDVLILQIFKIMDKIWLENDLDLKMSIYNVCPIELKCGYMEFVDGTVLEGVQKDEGFLGGALDRELLYNYLKKMSIKININDEETLSFENQLDNFIRSLAGYCVATGVLGIGDRHSANVMIKKNGIFFHIDFGHIFGNFKKKFGFKRERSRFLLTQDMAYVYIKSNNEEKFKNYCVRAYNILRHNGQRLINLTITMASAGMPEFSSMVDVGYFQNMLQLNKKNDEDAGNYFINLINESVNEKYRILDNLIHNIIHV